MNDDSRPVDRSTTSYAFLVNELILEYLESQQLVHTASVLRAESHHPTTADDSTTVLSRDTLCRELGLQDSDQSRKLPLLAVLVDMLRKEKLSRSMS